MESKTVALKKDSASGDSYNLDIDRSIGEEEFDDLYDNLVEDLEIGEANNLMKALPKNYDDLLGDV